MAWTAAGLSRTQIEAAGRRVMRLAGKQILIAAQDGALFAIANRCPHEGYPLSEGTLGPGCVITCPWHNWKFDLASGAALAGRDPVRRYDLEERGGQIFVDLTEPPADARKARALAGIDAALADYDRPRLARETVRLTMAGFPAADALRHAIAATAERFEDGMTHAHGAAADWLQLAAEAPDETRRLTATLEPLAHIAWDAHGAGHFPYTNEMREWNAGVFAAAMEAEDEDAAIALVRGALEENLPIARLRPAFARAALVHYADFGHSAIYTLKTFALIERLGESSAAPLLCLLTRALARASREDNIPEFRFYGPSLARWAAGGAVPLASEDLLGLDTPRILPRLAASSRLPAGTLYAALLEAAGHNLLRFDTAFDTASANSLADNISWLDFTHALTFANAVRQLCAETPALWPQALLQMALFIGRNAKYARAPADLPRWQVSDATAFLAEQMEGLFDHGLPEPVIACHRLKVLFALRDELAAAPDAAFAPALLAGVHRYLATPMKRHHSLRLAQQALDFIAKEG